MLHSSAIIHLLGVCRLLHSLEYVAADDYAAKDYGISWMYFPDGNDRMQIASLLNESDSSSIGRSEPMDDDFESSIYFELYTREHQQSAAAAGKSLLRKRRQADDIDEFRAYFRPNRQTKIIIHGWMSDTKSDFVQNIKDNYLTSRDCNVIAVSWPSRSIFYPVVAYNTRHVGAITAHLIDYLHVQLGAPMDSIHLIGHSLGAHTAGYAGFLSQHRIDRITGLDPALPGFASLTTGADNRLDATDADFVDIIHTGGGLYGLAEPAGDVDFYPNDGKPPQPGCGMVDKMDACSHGRSHQYFAESILSTVGFFGHACATWLEFEAGKCPRPSYAMGDPVARVARGSMFLHTNEQAPYAMGFV